MKRLGQFIDSHLDEFDMLEPNDGHFIRFKSKLYRKSGTAFRWALKVAAVLLAAAIISVNLLFFHSEKDENLSSDLMETACFYNMRSDKLLNEIENTALLSSNQKQVLLKDIKNIDKEYFPILDDLKNFPSDERLINAFIDYHRSKAEFLEDILKQVKTSNLIKI